MLEYIKILLKNRLENVASVASALLSYNAGKYYVFNLKIFNNLSTKKGLNIKNECFIIF